MTFYGCDDCPATLWATRRLLSVLDYSIFFSRLPSTRMKRPQMSHGRTERFETLQRSPAGAFLLTIDVLLGGPGALTEL